MAELLFDIKILCVVSGDHDTFADQLKVKDARMLYGIGLTITGGPVKLPPMFGPLNPWLGPQIRNNFGVKSATQAEHVTGHVMTKHVTERVCAKRDNFCTTEWKHIYLRAIFPPGIRILGSCFRTTGRENKYQFFAASLSSCSNRGLELAMSNGFRPRWYIIREASKCVCSSYLNPGRRRENVGVTSKACSGSSSSERFPVCQNSAISKQ